MIPSSQIWDSAQRNFPNFRPPGNRNDDFKKGGLNVEVYVNRFKEYMRRQKLSGFSYCVEKCCTYSALLCRSQYSKKHQNSLRISSSERKGISP